MCAKRNGFGEFTPFWLADLENSETYAQTPASLYSTPFSPQHSSLIYIFNAFTSRCVNKLRRVNKSV